MVEVECREVSFSSDEQIPSTFVSFAFRLSLFPFYLEKEAHTYHSAAEPESSPASPSRRGPRNQDGGHQAAELGQAADDNAFVFDGGADGGGGGADVALPSRWRCFSASSPPQPSLILRCCCSVS